MRRVLLLVALLVPACSFGQPRDTTTATTAAPPRVVYVAIGGSDSLDVSADAWPRQLFRLLPPQTVYVNVATPEATAADAARVQLPKALALEPTVATVWLPDVDPDGVAAIVTELRDRGAVVVTPGEVGVTRADDTSVIAERFLEALAPG